LFHYFRELVSWNEQQWDAYKNVNQKFADAVTKQYEPGDIIWVHDYHLLLLPAMLREEIPDALIGFFNHIPFPSYETFRILPQRREILNGMLGADLLGFHTYDYVRHFLDSLSHILGYEHTYDTISIDNRQIKADIFPMGIDYQKFEQAVSEPTVQHEIAGIRRKYAGYKIFLSVDRLDYTKGILKRLEAYDAFLEKNPAFQGRVVLVLVAVPSRTTVCHYRQLKEEVDQLVGDITGRYATLGWTPISYFYDTLSSETLTAMYHVADIALVTPLRDGMNLMAKEFLATRTDGSGVLILSEMAGASSELGEALIINPFNREDIVQAMERAMVMPPDEQVTRNRQMQDRLRRYDINYWVRDFIRELHLTREESNARKARSLTGTERARFLKTYKDATNRLIFLDYDGTLMGFTDLPSSAVPDEPVLALVRRLASIPGNEVVIVSGRDRVTLGTWFGDIPVGMVAEHGIWSKRADGDWQISDNLTKDWKEEILPVMNLFAERTPGSFIEEKEYSLVWHYRKTGPKLGELRSRELNNRLRFITANKNLEVLKGNKIIEVKNSSVNKGQAALQWISRRKWDFILAVGDDQTDEYLFDVVPDGQYSVKVGFSQSGARYNLSSVPEVRSLLADCILTDSAGDGESQVPVADNQSYLL